MTIFGRISGSREVAAKLRKRRPAVYAAIKESLTRSALKLVNRVKSQKLSGQVLNVQTGRLRRSITAAFKEESGVFKAMVGTNVWYGKLWEYGFDGAMQVKAHTRKVTKVFGRDLRAAVVASVRAHTRNVHMKERSFLRSALAESRSSINEDLRKRVAKAMSEVS